MNRWLIKWYPIDHTQQLTVTNLDILNYLDEYNFGAERKHPKDGEYVYYNNRTMRIIETDSVLDAVNKFFREMKYGGTKDEEKEG